MLLKEIDFLNDIFNAYPHQREGMRDFFSGQYQYYIDLIHRRGGKDADWFNRMWLAACLRPGNYIYMLPKIGQARNVVWEGTDLEGRKWRRQIPKSLIAKMNETECKIHFNNGSMVHITGADNILNAHLGSNVRGMVLSEFQRIHPQIWDYLRPIVKRSGGWAAFLYTALGKGHAYRLRLANTNNPKWKCRVLTVNDTRDNGGNYIFSPEQVQEERESGMDEELIQQEYYCDENVAVKGTYFADQLALAYKEGRVVKGLEVYPKLPVHTSWDLGSRDTNSIWFFQVITQAGKLPQFRYFYQHDKNFGDIDYYVALLEKVRQEYGFYLYGKHFIPHDIAQVEYTSQKTRRMVFMQKGITPTPVPMLRVIERVQIARSAFAQCWFDEVGCHYGLQALAASRAAYNESTRALSPDEVHDWASHGSAAFQYGHVGWMDNYNRPEMARQKEYARVRG